MRAKLDMQRFKIEMTEFVEKYGHIHENMANDLNAIRVRILKEEGIDENNMREILEEHAKKKRGKYKGYVSLKKMKRTSPGRPRTVPFGPHPEPPPKKEETVPKSSIPTVKRPRGRPRRIVIQQPEVSSK